MPASDGEDEDAKIRLAVEQSRQQVIDTDRKRAREHAITSRGEQRRKLNEDRPRHTQQWRGGAGSHARYQAGVGPFGQSAEGRPRPTGPRAVRGIPASMIVAHQQPETGTMLLYSCTMLFGIQPLVCVLMIAARVW
jgi:hypothetical protein